MIRFILTALCLLACIAPVWPDDKIDIARAKAKALLTLRKESRNATVAAEYPTCHISITLPAAEAKAKREGRQLFLWIGGCSPDLVKAFPEAVHCPLGTFNGDSTRRLLLPSGGQYLRWDESQFTPSNVESIRRAMKITTSSSSVGVSSVR